MSDKYAKRMKKLCLLYEGPYKVIGTKTLNAYIVKRRNNNLTATVNARRIRPYVEPIDPMTDEQPRQRCGRIINYQFR